jgi:prophage regulatory protein
MRLIRKAEVLEMVGVSYPTIWRWMRAGVFPKPLATINRSMWIEQEVADWIASLPRRQFKGEKNVKPISTFR